MLINLRVSSLGAVLMIGLAAALLQISVAHAAYSGCIVDTHTVVWDNTGGSYDDPCSEAGSNDYPCEWRPWPQGGKDCKVLICYNTDAFYACDEEILVLVTSGHTIQCQATVMLNTYCYALSGDAEAYWCDSEDCYWWALVTQAQLDALAQAFENSNQAAPHIHKTRVETCNC